MFFSHQSFEISISLFIVWPNWYIFSDCPKLSSLKFVQEVIVWVKKLLFFVTGVGHRQLNLTDKTSVNLTIDHDVASSLLQPVFYPHYFEFISVGLIDVYQILDDPYDFLFIRMDFAPQKIKEVEFNQIERVKIFSGPWLEHFWFISKLIFRNLFRYSQQKVNQFVELSTNVWRYNSLDVDWVHSNTNLLITKMNLRGIWCVFFSS